MRETVRLPVGKIILGSIVLVWEQRRPLIRVLAITAIIMVILDVVQERFAAKSFVYDLVFVLPYMIVVTMFCVNCHRFVLLGRDKVPTCGILAWTGREFRFLGWIIFIVIVYYAFVPIYILVATNIDESSAGLSAFARNWLSLIAMTLPPVYISARVSIMFPATAVDTRPSLHTIWNLTGGNGWRLAIIIVLFPIILSVFPILFTLLDDSLIAEISLSILTTALFVIEIVALSLSYRYLMDNAENYVSERS